MRKKLSIWLSLMMVMQWLIPSILGLETSIRIHAAGVGTSVVPSIVQYTPLTGATGIDHSNTMLKLQFNEKMALGNGNIHIRKVVDSSNVDVETLFVEAGELGPVSLDSTDPTATHHEIINIQTTKLEHSTAYYVLIDPDTFVDEVGLGFTGIDNKQVWTFTTTGNAASLTNTSPINGATGVSLNTPIELTFDQSVYPGSGNITIQSAGSSTAEANILVTSANLTGTGTNKISISTGITLQLNKIYTVTVPSGTFMDNGNRPIPSISWSFTAMGDLSPLVMTSISPANGSTTVPLSTDLTLTFNRAVKAANGGDTAVIRLYNAISSQSSNISVVVDARNPSQVRTTNKVTLDQNSSYYVIVDSGVFIDRLNGSIIYGGLNGSSNWSFKTMVYDKVAPVLQNTQMYNASTIRLIYNEPLDYTNSLYSTNFEVTVNGENRKISQVYTSGESVHVVLEVGISVGQNVRISYNAGNSSIRDLAHNPAASFGLRDVTNTIDSALPKPREGTAYSNTVALTFNETLKTPSTYAYQQFRVTADGSSLGVRSMSQSGTRLTLTLDKSISDGQVIQVSYTPGSYPIQNDRGLNMSAFSDFFVRNQLDSKAPIFMGAEGSGSKITLKYNEALRTDYLPMKSQLSVLVNNKPNYVTGVVITVNLVEITLASPLTTTEGVTISYVPGYGSQRITDLNGNSASYINLEAVSNGTTTVGTNPGNLATLHESEYGRMMYILNTSAATTSPGVTRNNQSINKYILDATQLTMAYDNVTTSGTGSKTIVFEVPSSEKAASVGVPLQSLQDAYYNNSQLEFAVKMGESILSVPIDSLKISEISRNLNMATSNAGMMIWYEIEKAPTYTMSAMLNQMNQFGANVIADPHEFYLSAENMASGERIPLNVSSEYFIRTMKSSPLSTSALVYIDTTTAQVSYIPTVVKKWSGGTLFTAKVRANYMVAGVTTNKYFGDVGNHWAKVEINELSSKFIADGRTSTFFEPNSNITRGEFAVFIAKGLGLPGDAQEADKFKDVRSSSTTGAYIGAATKAGIITGNTDGTFRADSYITREQLAIMMVRAMDYANYKSTNLSSSSTTLTQFKDRNKIQSQDSVSRAVNEGIIRGVTTTTFQPQGNATRAQAAVMLKRLLSTIGYM